MSVWDLSLDVHPESSPPASTLEDDDTEPAGQAGYIPFHLSLPHHLTQSSTSACLVSYVKNKLIISLRLTFELSDRYFHVFLPAASWAGKSYHWNDAFAPLQVLFQCASNISIACAPAPFCVLYYLLSNPSMGCTPGLGFADHNRTTTEASILHRYTNAFFNSIKYAGKKFPTGTCSPPFSFQQVLNKSWMKPVKSWFCLCQGHVT